MIRMMGQARPHKVAREAAIFSPSPPKPPLLMMTILSFPLSWACIAAIMASLPSSCTIPPAFDCPLSAGGNPTPSPPLTMAQSAWARASVKAPPWPPPVADKRMVLERNSTAAITRRPGCRARRAAMVWRMAVGWWAKSSYKHTPPDSNSNSRRRAAGR